MRPVAIETVRKLRFAAVPADVRWRLRPTGGSTLNHSGATPLSWGIAPDSINSSRKGTALPHIGRHSRELEFSHNLYRSRFRICRFTLLESVATHCGPGEIAWSVV